MTHHLHNTRTLEIQKGKVLYYVYITKYHKIIQDTEIFCKILKRAVISSGLRNVQSVQMHRGLPI